MVKKTLSFFLFLVLLSSCSDAPLLVKDVSINQNAIAECDTTPCPQINVDYIQYTGEQDVITPINAHIERYIIEALYQGDVKKKPTAKNAKEAIQAFITNYWRATSEFPEINEYEADVTIAETHRSNEIATVALTHYTYTGGAHGYGAVHYQNFDIETGQLLTLDQLIKDIDGLTALAEKQLRNDFNISEEDNINATLFWFEDDAFYLSDAIGVENNKLVIHYDQYEIASYADGPIDIELDLDAVAPFLNYALKN